MLLTSEDMFDLPTVLWMSDNCKKRKFETIGYGRLY